MSQNLNDSSANLSDVQERLMRMLDSVRLDKSAEPPRPARPVPTTPQAAAAGPRIANVAAVAAPSRGAQQASESACKNCGSTESWNGSAWCPACGYHPAFGRVVVDTTVEEDQGPINLWQVIPGWLYWVIGIVFVLLIESLLFRIAVPQVEIRGQIAILQIILGLAVFLGAHARAFFIASHASEKIGPGSFLYDPGNIWKLVCTKLPQSNKVVICGSSGLAAAFLAVTLIGLDWNALFKPQEQANKPKFNPLKAVMQGAMMVANMKQGAGGGGAMAAMSGDMPDMGGDPLAGSIASFADLSGGGMLAQGAGPTGNVSMEDALSDFAGAAGVNELLQSAPPPGAGRSSGGSGDIGDSIGSFVGEIGVDEIMNQAAPPGGSSGGRDIGSALTDFTDAAGTDQVFQNGVLQDGSFTTARHSTEDPNVTAHSGKIGGFTSPEQLQGRPEGGPESAEDSSVSLKVPGIRSGTTATTEDAPRSNVQTITSQGGAPASSGPSRSKERGEFHIFGYLTNAGGELRSVLLAELDDKNRGKYVGRLSLVGFDEKRLIELKAALDEHRSDSPALPAPYRARWTKLIVKCVVLHEGVGADGNLRSGQLVSFEKTPEKNAKSDRKVAAQPR